jgi:hypothetical protein
LGRFRTVYFRARPLDEARNCDGCLALYRQKRIGKWRFSALREGAAQPRDESRSENIAAFGGRCAKTTRALNRGYAEPIASRRGGLLQKSGPLFKEMPWTIL